MVSSFDGKYTLVRHTGWSMGSKYEFEQAVEERAIDVATTVAVVRAGGLIFNGYSAARDAAHAYNYPPGNQGLVPTAAGKFVDVKTLGEEIFVPTNALETVKS